MCSREGRNWAWQPVVVGLLKRLAAFQQKASSGDEVSVRGDSLSGVALPGRRYFVTFQPRRKTGRFSYQDRSSRPIPGGRVSPTIRPWPSTRMGQSDEATCGWYRIAVAQGIDRGLEAYGITNALQIFLFEMGKTWEGTYLALLGELNSIRGSDRSNWPKSPLGLAGQLKRIAPGLRQLGIEIEPLGHTRNGSRIRITRSREEESSAKERHIVTSSHPSKCM